MPDPTTNPAPDKTRSRTAWSRVAAVLRWLFAAFVVMVYVGAYLANQLYPVLLLTLPVFVFALFLSRTWAAIRGRVTAQLVRHPRRKDSRPYLLQFLNRLLCYALVAAALTLSIPAFQLTSDEFIASLLIFAWGPLAALLVIELLPAKPVRISFNAIFLVLWLSLAVDLGRVFISPLVSEPVTLTPPFAGEWVVFQGGRSSLLNHHYRITAQRHALDLTVRDVAVSQRENPESLESYATFGAPMFAPADGVVIHAVNDRPDQAIGTTDLETLVGNHVVIAMPDGRFVLLAHLEEGSVEVAVGQTVRAGQHIARCGNSGNTSEPHLHLQVQSHADWTEPELHTFPIRFRDITHIRWGRHYGEQQGELRRNDIIVTEDPDH